MELYLNCPVCVHDMVFAQAQPLPVPALELLYTACITHTSPEIEPGPLWGEPNALLAWSQPVPLE